MSNTLKKLYEKYESSLGDDKCVMQDDILQILIQMEVEIGRIMEESQIEIDLKRFRRYGLIRKDTNHLHHNITQEVGVMKRYTSKALSVQHMLSQVARRRDRVMHLISDQDYQTICSDLGISYRVHTDGGVMPFVPTDGDRAPQTGSGTGWQSSESRSPKLLELITLLRQISTPDGGYIDTRDIHIDLQTETPDRMMRTTPYVIVRIPRLSRTILIDDRIGEATYILQGLVDIDIIRRSTKSTLQTDYHAQRVIHNPAYTDTVIRYLTTDWDTVDSTPETPHQNIPTPRIDMDRAILFLDTDTIRANLQSFVGQVMISIAGLTTGNPKPNTKITLSNGVEMTWDAFLINASRYLLRTKKGEHKKAEALEMMCEMIGIQRINEKYFQNIKNITTDLQSFVGQVMISIAGLTTGNPKPNTKITLSNGVEMTWLTFLNNASRCLLNTTDGTHKQAEALEMMCEMIGIQRINEKYFQNIKNITTDLQLFANIAGVSIVEIHTGNPPKNTTVTLSNGVEMTWETFLINASRCLLNTTDDTHKLAESLEMMCEMIGIQRINEKYFQNIKNITTDLQLFANIAGVSIAGLTTSNPKPNTKITLSNGVEMTCGAFFNNASKYLLNTTKGTHKLAESLEMMCEMIGIQRINEKYFQNIKNITTDLQLFANIAGVSIAGLTTGNPKPNTKITLSNGVDMTWVTFLNNASKYLLRTKKGEHKQVEALEMMCEMIGVVRVKRSR